MKSKALSFEEVYQRDHSTVLSGFTITNSAASDAYLISSTLANFKNFFSNSPSFLLISMDGILIPAPVPSSDMITSLTSSLELSIMTAKLPPAFSMFLTLVTNEQFPLSTKKMGVRIPSGSPEKSLVKLPLKQPSGFEAL